MRAPIRGRSSAPKTTTTITSPVEAVRTIMLRMRPVCVRALWNV